MEKESDRIWNHYQTTRVEVFSNALGRHAAVAAEAARRIGRRRGRVLNIGIGSGDLERLLQARGWRVAALDPSEATVDAMAGSGIDARCGHAQRMPFDTGSFDVVIASEVLEHIEPATRVEVLAEISRVLDNNGWFVGTVPYREVLADNEVFCPHCGEVFHRWGHVSSFDAMALRSELAGVFDAVRCGRRSFVDWSVAVRSPLRLLKGVVQSVLGRLGEPIASPNLLFAARRRRDAVADR